MTDEWFLVFFGFGQLLVALAVGWCWFRVMERFNPRHDTRRNRSDWFPRHTKHIRLHWR